MPRQIALNGKYGQGRFMLCDDGDFDLLAAHRWVAQEGRSTFYGYAKDGGCTLIAHRLLLSPPDHITVDHINGNGLDNRRENLRLCTPSENLCNQKSTEGSTSQFLGVWKRASAPSWRAGITKNGDKRKLGSYRSEKDAARAYDYWAEKLHGRYANLNFPHLPRVHPSQLASKVELGGHVTPPNT